MAEIEISVLKGQCLNRRMATVEELGQEIAAWEHERNQKNATVEWRFTSQNARKKLTRLYPELEKEKDIETTCQN